MKDQLQIAYSIRDYLKKENPKKALDLPMMPINTLVEILGDLEFEMEDLGDNLNSWSVDFFYNFNNKEKGKYTLSGSLWYGGFSFEKSDDEDED